MRHNLLYITWTLRGFVCAAYKHKGILILDCVDMYNCKYFEYMFWKKSETPDKGRNMCNI
jgi:hypothetical protein